MTILKQRLKEGWQLVYDTEDRKLHVMTPEAELGLDAALKLKGEGADSLRLAIIDLFDGPVSSERDWVDTTCTASVTIDEGPKKPIGI